MWKASLPLPQLLKLGITQLGQVTDPGLSTQQLMTSKKMPVAKTENKKVPKIFMSPVASSKTWLNKWTVEVSWGVLTNILKSIM